MHFAEHSLNQDSVTQYTGTTPRTIISDKGCQFFNRKAHKPACAYHDWLRLHSIKPRFGAIGKKGSIAIIERFMRTLKTEGTRRFLVPYSTQELDVESHIFAEWYNSKRPHSALMNATPDEVFYQTATEEPKARLEPRPLYPIQASDNTADRVVRIGHIQLKTAAFRERKHLPLIELEAA